MMRVAHLALVAVFTMAFVVFGAPSARAAVTPLQNWPSTPQITGTSQNLSGTFTVSAGSNRLLVVIVDAYQNGGLASGWTATATYGAAGGSYPVQNFVTGPVSPGGGSNYRGTAILYLDEAGIAAAQADGENQINISVNSGSQFSVYIASYSGVDQTTPIEASGSNYASSVTNITYGPLASSAGGYGVFGVCANSNSTANNESYAQTTNNTSTQNTVVGYKALTGTTTNPSISWGGNTYASVAGITIKQLSCVENQTVTLDTIGDPILGATTISATSGGTNIEVSDDNATWHASPWTYTPPANSSGSVTFYARAQGTCATISATPVTVTYDTTCTDPTPSTITIPSGQTAFGDGYDASSLVTTTGDPKANLNLEFQITQQQTTAGSTITAGAGATNLGTDILQYGEYTMFGRTNPASQAGTIDHIEAWISSGSGQLDVIIGYGTPPTYTVRHKVTLNVTGTGLQTWNAPADFTAFNIQAGDYVGLHNPASAVGYTFGGTGQLDYAGGDTTTGTNTYTNLNSDLSVYVSGTTAPVNTEVACTNWTANSAVPTTTAGGSLCGNYTDGGTYTLYVRGTDPPCGTPIVSSPVSQSFTWNSCTESRTLALDALTNPITGSVNVTATQTGGVPDVQVGDTSPPTNASGWTYNPPLDATGSVTFYAQGTGTCATLTDSATYSYNTVAAPTITAFSVPANISGTLNVPITTFTASDNVGVTGYLITTSATAPSGGAAGWSGTAPTTFNVGAYGSYTLYAWAKDAAGNVSASASATVNVSSCTETGTVTLSALPNPITGAVTVSATVGGGATNPEVSFDGGTTWQPSGSTYTPPARWAGTVNFAVRAMGSCGINYVYDGASSTTLVTIPVNVDSRANTLYPLLGSAAQSGLTGIKVTFVYCDDKNGNATFTVRYKLSTDTVWTALPAVTDGGAGDTDGVRNQSVVVMLSGLTTGATYDVEMTYADADGFTAGGSPAVQTASVTLVSWVDSPLLHNALRFACSKPGYSDQASCTAAGGTWNLDRMYVGGWGTDTGTYGPITCNTCHARNSGNIKRITSAISSSTGSFPGSAVSFTTATDGSSDFGNDAGGHTASTKICEVCHSKTSHHRYDTTAQTDGLSHYNQADCTKCHEHKNGFRASCNACHGNPPLSTGELTATLYPSGSTGSTTEGAHNRHVVTQGFACDTCHSGWQTSGQMPNGGNINIGLQPSANSQFATATATVDGGSYDGRTGAAYTAAAGTTVTNGNGLTCANYCHGYGTPSWTATAGTVVCGSCHGQTTGAYGDNRDGAPDGNVYPGSKGGKDLSGALSGFKVGKHANHLDNSIAKTGDPCKLCHDGFGYGTSGHLDGTVEVKLNAAAGAGATFTPGNGTTPGTCSNISCHGTANWDSAATGGCNFCHGYPPTSTTAHAPGVQPVNHDAFTDGGAGVTANHDTCTYCHGYKDDGTGTLTPLTAAEITAMKGDSTIAGSLASYHQDTKVTINMDGNGNVNDDARYNPSNGGCDNSACHANDTAHEFTLGATKNTLQAADIGPGSCGTCHDTGVGGAPVVNSTSSHVITTVGGTFGACTDCHSGHYAKAGGVQIPNNTTVGVNYTKSGHGGIKLGGPGTVASISSKTTEAEICWGCHDQAANGISEWGTNDAQAGSPVPTQYNYGTLNTSNWTTATWTSAKSAFSYKTGAIESTHSVNSAGTSAVTGSAYNYTESPDAVANIRCSYCHDVHDTAGSRGVTGDVNGKPYLRGTWWSNPYEEDGAPQSGTAYVNDQRFGSVPRGNGAATKRLGGYWIDANNVEPGTASTTADGIAYPNPTASGGHGTGGAWTLADSAGLCTLCHGTNVDAMDQTTGENLWVATNGHSNAVIGGSGSNAANIFNLRGGATGCSNNPAMHWTGCGAPGDSGSGYGYRNGSKSRVNYTPYLNPYSTENNDNRTSPTNNWGSLTVDANTINTQYHKFSCSKCHNPHASRLPKLMITNCLDTKHNTWDDSYQLNTANSTSINYNRSISNWSTAQNCHRLGGIADGTGPEPVDPGAVGATHGTGTDYANRGWNVVTPWTK